MDPTATATRTVTTPGMIMEIPAMAMGTTTDPMTTAPNTVTTATTGPMSTATDTVTTAEMAMEIPATVMGTATRLAMAMQANTAPEVDRGYPNYNSDSLVPVIITGQSMESSGHRRSKQSAPMRRTTDTQAHQPPHPLPPVPSVSVS